jgi:cysteine desulfurase/selenocysteine lyase
MSTRAVASTSPARGRTAGFDVPRVRADFPLLAQRLDGRPLIYLDNAATSQKPRSVIDAERRYYEHDNSNVHRGVHALSIRATEAFEGARRAAQRLLNAAHPEEIIFVRGTTEAVNLVAQTCGRTRVQSGDEVLVTTLEHHSNIVPWQILCEQTGARLRVAPISDSGELLWDEFVRLLGPRTRIAAFAHVSNALGTINPVREMVAAAHEHGATVLVDGAQAAPHLAVDVRALDCDFYAISSHKMYGPMGVGVLYGKCALLETLPPYQGGGEMIRSVTFEKTVYNTLPHRFEAGTPNVGGAVGFAAAIDYVQSIGLERIAAYETELLRHATEALAAIPQVRLIGTARHKAAVVSFVVQGVHAHDVGTILDREGIAVRSGHHCAEPLMHRFGLDATARASFSFYNTHEEIEALAAGVRKVVEVFS